MPKSATSSKLSHYSMLAAAILAGQERISAQVLITDTDPELYLELDVFEFSDDQSTLIDIDQDGNFDFSFEILFDEICGYCAGLNFGIISPLESNNINFATQTAYTSCFYLVHTFDIFNQLGYSAIVDVSLNQTDSPIHIFLFNGGDGDCTSGPIGDDDFSEKFAGFVLIKPDGPHYGWIRLTVTDFAHLYIDSYAYELQPNTPVTTPEAGSGDIVIEGLSDIGDASDGTDLQFMINNTLSEENLVSYKVICVREEDAADFTFLDALSLPPDMYKTIIPTGAFTYTATFDADSKSTNGEFINNYIYYNTYCLATFVNGVDTTYRLSSLSSFVYLKTVTPSIDINLNDITNFENASDLQLSFLAPENEAGVGEYRLMVTRNEDLLNLATLLAVPPEEYISVVPSGEDVEIVLPVSMLDIEGNLITCGEQYYGAVLTLKNDIGDFNRYNATEAEILNCSTAVATNLLLTDKNIFENASDYELTFEIPESNNTIDHFELMLIPESEAATFTLADALAVLPENRFQVYATEPGIFTYQFLPTAHDVSNNAIVDGSDYVAAVLSIASLYGINDTLSDFSNNVTIHFDAISNIQILTGLEVTYNDFQLNIILNNSSIQQLKFQLFNIEGKLFYENIAINGDNTYSLSLIPGIYFVALNSNNTRDVVRIIVN